MAFQHISHHADIALRHMYGRMEGTIQSIPTPWKRYNDVGIDGIEFHSITLIAAMSGGGKTAAANQIAAESFDLAPDLDHYVLDFNFEMLGKNLVMRNVSANKGMTMQYLNSSQGYKLAMEEYRDIEDYIKTVLCKKPYYIVDEPASAEAIMYDVEKFYQKYKKKMLATLDHTILTKKVATENSQLDTLQSLGAMCTESKKKIPIAWLILSQLNRSIEGAERTITGSSAAFPTKADIYGGDALYQHADMVTVIHRPFLLGIGLYGKDKIKCDKNTLFFHNLKVRNGDTNILKMEADFANMKIIDPEEPQQGSQIKFKITSRP
jgi:replicative DNA helicase